MVTKIWLGLLLVILVALTLWGVFFVKDIDSKISIFGIVTIVVAAFTSVLTVNINNRKTRDREYELHILKEKQKVFEHYYNGYFEAANQTRAGRKGLSKKGEDEMMLFKKGLMNWGSDTFIEKFLELENRVIEESESGKGDAKRMINNGNMIFLEIRKELGFKDSGDLNIMSIILTPEARNEIGL